MSLVSDNIRYLRKLNGLTQEQFSRKINIKRSLLGAYEEARANPNQQNMQAIAKAFNTTVELLTRQDLRKLRETPTLSIPLGQKASSPERIHPTSAIRSDGLIDAEADDPFQHPDFPDIFAQPDPKASATPEPQPLSSVLNKYYRPQEPVRESRPAPAPPVITPPVRPTSERVQPEVLSFNNVFEGETPTSQPFSVSHPAAPLIPVVMLTYFTEYGHQRQQPDFLHRLPTMQLPTLSEGSYRAFEAGEDFTFPGALLVGQFVRNWFDIADGQMYILLLQRADGVRPICCRRIYNQVKVKGTLLLTADRPDVPNQEVALKDVLEVWEIKAFVSQQLPPPSPSTDRLRQLVEELRFEIERL
jgi:transcriptional regulator with XRE-family HTH domain